jgi:uncharacterized repeat protein (TIGR01451 family)
VRRDADLFLKKTVTPDPIAVGEAVTWTIVATNMGPAPATGVTLTDPIPSAVKSPAVSSSQGSCTLAGGVVTCALGDLAVNAMATVTITATRESQQAFSNTATVTAMQPDNDPGNNQSTATTGAATPEISRQLQGRRRRRSGRRRRSRLLYRDRHAHDHQAEHPAAGGSTGR